MTICTATLRHTPDDGLATDTSEEQHEVELLLREIVAAYQPDDDGSPPERDIDEVVLDRNRHFSFLSPLLSGLPANFVSLDASRPWLLYWITHSFAIMDAELDPTGRQRAVSTLSHCRPSPDSPRGGFGGGPGQRPHLATTYAATLALAYVGDEKTWGDPSIIERRAMHDWLLSLKQPDGSFVMHEGGEVDIRGCYCALTVATLLNILTPDLARGTAAFAASCQTYEGGLASSSYPFASGNRPPLGEAHGGYAFCALATHYLLLPFASSTPAAPTSSIPTLDVPLLFRWTASMQALPIEAGGFRGRTNKLVDGCYGWWCGGIGALLASLLSPNGSEPDGTFEVFDRDALQEYVLIAAQAPNGGLIDKPGKPADAYHTCYNLSGLSAAQHRMVHSPALAEGLRESFVKPEAVELIKGAGESDDEARRRMASLYAHALGWREEVSAKRIRGVKENEVIVTHPVFNITTSKATLMLNYYYEQPELIST